MNLDERSYGVSTDKLRIDVYIGQATNETITGTGGNDLIFAGKGTDVIRGGDGDDVIAGGDGNDDLGGGKGDDLILAGEGRDVYALRHEGTGGGGLKAKLSLEKRPMRIIIRYWARLMTID